MAFLLLLAGISDALGLASLLPLISLVSDGEASGGLIADAVASVFSLVGAEPTLVGLLAVVVAGTTLRGAFTFLATRQAGYASAAFSAELRLRLVRALMVARWSHFVGQAVGRLSNAMGVEANRASSTLVDTAALGASAIQVLIYLGLSLFVSWQVSLAAVVLGGVMATMLRSLVRSSRQAGREYTLVLRSLTSRLVDSLGAIKPVRAMGRSESLQRLLEDEVAELEHAQRHRVLSQSSLAATQEPVSVLLLAVGVYVVATRDLVPFDQLLFLAFLFQRSMSRIGLLQRQYQLVRTEESALWSILESIEDAASSRESHSGTRQPTLNRGIEFVGVDFDYEGRSVLSGLHATIPANRFTAVVGASGVGKTTLADILVRLHVPQSGDVLLDGVPLEEVEVRAWRRMVGYVPQEPVLFHESVLVNVTLKDPHLSREAAWFALEQAGAREFVAALPGGLDSTVGERGLRLSGGQRQRLSIARAIVTQPRLLILDEATSGLDRPTERAVYETIARLRNDMTIVVITHQPTALEYADHVIELGGDQSDHAAR